MTNWQLWNLLKEKKIISENKYYLDGRERKVSRTRKLAVVLPFIVLILFGVLFLWYTDKVTSGITGKLTLCCHEEWVQVDPYVGGYWITLCGECMGGGGSPYCGDGYCNGNENCGNCGDCRCAAGKYCGLRDDSYSCLNIPVIPKCGDGYCDANGREDCSSCESDCGCDYSENCYESIITKKFSCIDESLPSKCGDGFCTSKEDCSSCESDCGCSDGGYCSFNIKAFSYSCVNSPVSCGNKICNAGEDCNSCSGDCKCAGGKYCYDNKTNIYKCYDNPSTLKCGDGFCSAGEDCKNCRSDCGCGFGRNCGYNNVTDTYGCKSIRVKCENGFCDKEGEEGEEDEETEEGREEDPCIEVKDIVERIECQEEWKCDWSMCVNGRTEAYNCEDLNNCRTSKYKPTYKDCISLKSDCTPELECREWSECELDILQEVVSIEEDFKGTKTRICEDKSKCLVAFSEVRECKIKKPSSVMVYSNNLVRICSESKTVARIIPSISKHGLDIDLILGRDRKLEKEIVEKPSIDWAKLKGGVPYLIYILIIIFTAKIFILIGRRRKERMESARAVRIIRHMMAKAESARLKHEREEAERYYKKARLYYRYLAEDEKLKVIRRLKMLENKLGQSL